MLSHISLGFPRFFIFVFLQFGNDLSRSWSLWVYHIWDLLSFSNVQINVFHQIWKVFNNYLFKYSSCSFLCLLSFWDFHYIYLGTIDVVTQVSKVLFIFFFILSTSLLFRLDNLNLFIFKFIDSFLCQFKFDIEPFWWNFYFSYCNYQLQNFYLVYLL